MEFKEIINAIRQYPWQVTVAVISLIPLYIIDLKFLAKRKSWAEQKKLKLQKNADMSQRE